MYSKRDAFILLDMDNPIVYASDQTQRLAHLIVAMKNCETIQYFMEYLAYIYNGLSNYQRQGQRSW